MMFSFYSIMPNAAWKETSKTTIDTNPKSWVRAGVNVSQPCLSGIQSSLDCDTFQGSAFLPEVSLIFTLPCAFFLGYTWCIDLLASMDHESDQRGLLEKGLRGKKSHSKN